MSTSQEQIFKHPGDSPRMFPAPGDAVAIVPAYNEERCIGRTLDALCGARESGALQGIVVVDDGSKDRTGAIARGYGVDVLENTHFGVPWNHGKLYSFVHGLRESLPRAPGVVLASDADLLTLTPSMVEDFLGLFRERDLGMLIGTYLQGSDWFSAPRCPAHLSGFRAMRAGLLAPFYDPSRRGEFPWMASALALRRWEGYALETVINAIMPDDAVRYVDMPLTSRERGGSCGARAINEAIGLGNAITRRDITYGKRHFLGALARSAA